MTSHDSKQFVCSKGFTPLSQLSNHVGQFVDVIGAVVDHREPVKSNGTDWTMAMTICDKTKSSVENGFKIRIFRPSKEDLPQIEDNDDIIIFSKLKIQISPRDSMPSGISSWGTSWVVSHMSIVTRKATLHPPLTIETELISEIRKLRDWWANRGGSIGARGIAPNAYQKLEDQSSRKRRFVFIRDMLLDCFYDITGEVVKTFPGTENFTVYLTDYTSNDKLYNYGWRKYAYPQGGDDFDYTGRKGSDWNGPFGQYTLQVTLWDIHAKVARKAVREGLVIHLKNVRARKNRDGLLEGTLHGDKKYPNHVGVEVVNNKNDRALIGLSTRKKEYLRKFEQQKAEELAKIEKETTRAKSKEAKRLLEEEEERKWEEELNKNVRANKPDHPVTPISEIIVPKDPTSSSFTNRKYRIHCRVVDFMPHRLEEFAVRKPPKPEKHYSVDSQKWKRKKVVNNTNNSKESSDVLPSLSDGETTEGPSDDNEDDNDEQTRNWEWRFGLLVQGRDGALMKIMVDNEAAQYLLKLDAADLTIHTNKLGVLREKLFILWGDLEERKSARLKMALKNARNIHHHNNNNNKKRKGGNGNNKDSKRRKNNNKSSDGGDRYYDEDTKDEDGGGDSLIRGRGKFFEACVMEYGVMRRGTGKGGEKGRESGYWEKMFMLFGTTILI